MSHTALLQLGGGLFLCYLGVRTFLARPAARSAAPGGALAGAYASTMLLTLTNPMTTLSSAAVFAGLGLGAGAGAADYAGAVWLVTGVFLGSAAWWLLLSASVGMFREKLGDHELQWVNRASWTLI